MVSVQCGELFAIVPGERVPCVAVVTAHSELVEVSLVLHPETGVLGEHLPPRPVLQCDKEFIVPLVRQPVDVLQTQPVLAVDIAKSLLWRDKHFSFGDVFLERCFGGLLTFSLDVWGVSQLTLQHSECSPAIYELSY